MNTTAEIKDLCDALDKGETIQRRKRGSNESWYGRMCDLPNFDFDTFEYRRKPAKNRVPLGPEDFPPGTAIHHSSWGADEYTMVQSGNASGITASDYQYSWDDLAEEAEVVSAGHSGHWLRLLPGSTKWLPCYREE